MEPKTSFLEPLPSLAELGSELADVSNWQRYSAIALPFLSVAANFVFAWNSWWIPAILSVAAYTFFSYGSTSHDLVHANLGLPNWLNRLLLSLIELLGIRSGQAYRFAHLHHHKVFPDHDDVEGEAAYGSLLHALLAGPIQQFRIWLWAIRISRRDRFWIASEGLLCAAAIIGSVWALRVTPIPFVYVALAIMGSWTFPLITAYMPHDPNGMDKLHQTRRYRGKVADFVFHRHLYHLEHHLFPKIPHHNWSRLAKRLDPYLDRAGIHPIKFGF